MDTDEFDWQTQTARRGTVSRIQRYVRGDCGRCDEKNALLYDPKTGNDEDPLICASCSRKRAMAAPKIQEECDNGDGRPAWRDPLSGKNEFFCAQCHAANGTVFQNRWSEKARESRVLSTTPQAVCAAANHGTECKGEKKWRSAEKMILCNKHAGKKSNGPEWHQ